MSSLLIRLFLDTHIALLVIGQIWYASRTGASIHVFYYLLLTLTPLIAPIAMAVIEMVQGMMSGELYLKSTASGKRRPDPRILLVVMALIGFLFVLEITSYLAQTLTVVELLFVFYITGVSTVMVYRGLQATKVTIADHTQRDKTNQSNLILDHEKRQQLVANHTKPWSHTMTQFIYLCALTPLLIPIIETITAGNTEPEHAMFVVLWVYLGQVYTRTGIYLLEVGYFKTISQFSILITWVPLVVTMIVAFALR